MTIKQPASSAHMALRRWKLGHRVLHVQLEGMILLIKLCRALIRMKDDQRLISNLKLLSGLYKASTCSFRYASDFRPDLYAAVIRPSMMPPFLPSGFSGTLNRRHQEMKKSLGALQRDIKALLEERVSDSSEQICLAWKGVEQAKAENLKNHGLICSRFVPGGQSLLREYYRNTNANGKEHTP